MLRPDPYNFLVYTSRTRAYIETREYGLREWSDSFHPLESPRQVNAGVSWQSVRCHLPVP